MNNLWDAIGRLASELHPDRVDAVAESIGNLDGSGSLPKVRQAFGPNMDETLINRLEKSWAEVPAVSPIEVAAALKASCRTANLIRDEESIQLVWTGPESPFVPTRQTQAAILEVIDSAKEDLFLVSYVLSGADSILESLSRAASSGVNVSILLEPSRDEGGNVDVGGIETMKSAVPAANLYVWDVSERAASNPGRKPSVHAKCTVADQEYAFITSANLTDAALGWNMELGVLIRGGSVPATLRDHLQSLISTRVLQRA